MIELRLIDTGQVLELAPNTTISLELHNPVFGDTVFPGSFSYSFSLAGALTSSRNAQALGFADRLDVETEGQPVHAVELRLQGLPWQRGTLTLLSASPSRYKVKFLGEISLLGERFANTKLADLEHNPIPLATDVLADLDGGQYLTDVTYQPGNDPAPADISRAKNNGRGNKFFRFSTEDQIGSNTPLRVVINGQDFTLDDQPTNEPNYKRLFALSELVTNSSLPVQAVSYYHDDQNQVNDTDYHVFYVYGTSEDYDEPLEVSFPSSDTGIASPVWEIVNRWEDDFVGLISTELSQYANNSIPANDFVFPPFLNDELLGDGRNWIGLHNAYNQAGDQLLLHRPAEAFTEANVFGVVPMFSLEYVLGRIEAVTGVRIIGTWRDDPDVQKLIFFNQHALNVYAEDGTPSLSGVIDPANHLPDWTINELMIQLARLFCLGFDYQAGDSTLELFPLQDVLSVPTQDRTGQADPSYQVDFAAQEGATFSFEKAEEVDDLTIGEGKEKKAMKIGTVPTKIWADGSAGFLFELPYSSGEGMLGDEPGSEDTARLLLFHGVQTLDNFQTYPYASSTDNLNNAALSRFSLLWTGDNNLYDTWWKDWYGFESTRKSVPRTLYWTIRDLLTYHHRQPYRIKERDYLFAKLKLSINQRSGLGPVQVDAYTIEP